ncbi:MAG: acyl-CoA thioesterase [Bacteroidota bacterium]|nr:acyl-CoA thioesterase [Bacteroidota bacterium]
MSTTEPTRKHKSCFTVRGYELDSYGHLNNAVYVQYLEQARWEWTRDTGILEIFQDKDIFLIVIETKIRYMQEALLFDELRVETEAKPANPFIVFNQRIINQKTGKTISRATVRTLFVDRKKIPQDIPDIVTKKINEAIYV